jgi:hypothetical protein
MERLDYYDQGGECQVALPAEQLNANGYFESCAIPHLRRLRDYEPQPGACPPGNASSQDESMLDGLSRASAFQLGLDLRWAQEHRPTNPEGRVEPADASATRNILAAAVEVLDGRRPAAQIRNYFSPLVFAAVQTRAREFARVPQGLYLRSVHAYQPAKGVIEACATIERGKRFQALAARLESNGEGWLCKLLRLV